MDEDIMGIIEQRRLTREDAIRKARELAERVKNCLSKVSVVLVGSYTRGDFKWSDIDILIHSRGNFRQSTGENGLSNRQMPTIRRN